MGTYKVLKEYIEYLISISQQELENINSNEEVIKHKEIKQNYEQLKSIILELNIQKLEQNKETIKEYIKNIIQGTSEERIEQANQHFLQLVALAKSKPIFDNKGVDISEFPQYGGLLLNYQNLLEKIDEVILTSEEIIDNKKLKNKLEIENHQKILNLFTEKGLKRSLTTEELNTIKKYIVNSNLEEKLKFEMIGKIYSDNLGLLHQELTIDRIPEELSDPKDKQLIEITEQDIEIADESINKIESVLRILEKYNLHSMTMLPKKRMIEGIKIYLSRGEIEEAEMVANTNNMTLPEVKTIIEMLALKERYEEYHSYVLKIKTDEESEKKSDLVYAKLAQEELVEQYNKTANQLEEYLSEKELEEETAIIENGEMPELSHAKHIVLYLDEKEDVMKDIISAETINPDNLKQIQKHLTRMIRRSRTELLASSPIHRILPTKHITSFTDEFNPMSYRYKDIRFGVIELGISKKNKELLEKKYNLDSDYRILLLTNIEYKRGSKEQVYSKMNSKISNNSRKISQIADIFLKDFTPKTLQQATEIIEQSCGITNSIKTQPTGRSKK